MRKRLAGATAAVTAFALLTAGACSNSDNAGPSRVPIGQPNLQLVSALERFDSCDGVLNTIRAQAGKRVTAFGIEGLSGLGAPGFATAADAVAPSAAAGRATDAPTTTGAPTVDEKSASGGAAGQQADNRAAEPGQAQTPAHSGTNVQEVGVDEPDLAKTDGTRLFTLTNGTLRSFRIENNIPRPAGTLDLTNRTGGFGGEQQLLLAGDKLLVLTKGVNGPVPASTRRGAAVDDVEEIAPTSTIGTQLVEVDATDLANMKESSQITIDGTVVDARLVNNTARVVLESSPAVLNFVRPSSSTRKAQDAAKAANKRIVDESTTDDWLPQYTVAGSNERRALVECANVSHPKQFGGFGMVTVLTVEIGKGINPRNSIAIQADADKVYATKDRLFVSTNRLPEPTTTTNGNSGVSSSGTVQSGAAQSGAAQSGTVVGNSSSGNAATGVTTPGSAAGDETVGTPVRPTAVAPSPPITCDPACPRPTDVIPTTTPPIACDPACPPPSDRVPATTLPSPKPSPEPEYRTSIHEFDISGSASAVYLASGDVRGHIMNDFSMSARDGYLRVATTDGSPFRSTVNGESFVTVMHEENGELKQVGQIGGMGKGEQIKSVRFIGPTGYVVTFRQTDPLYTVDISDPRNPRVAGELKILGYSAYLHPISNNLLLGVGQDATDRGRTTGTQVSLFDVANPADPKLLQKVALPNARSDAENDYHAFLWWDPTKLAMIPVQSYGGPTTVPTCPPDADCATTNAASPSSGFVGAIGFTVDANGIKELGRVVNPLTAGSSGPGTPICPTAGPCQVPNPGPTVPGPTVTTAPPTTLPADPEVRKACIASGACPQPAPAGVGSGGSGGAAPSTTEPELTCEQANACASTTTTIARPATTSSTSTTVIECFAAPCTSEPIPPTTVCAPDQCTGPSTTSTTAPTSTTSTTTKPADGCDPMCPVPPIVGTMGAPIERGIVVGDRIYTLSSNGLLVSELSTLKPLGWVPFS